MFVAGEKGNVVGSTSGEEGGSRSQLPPVTSGAASRSSTAKPWGWNCLRLLPEEGHQEAALTPNYHPLEHTLNPSEVASVLCWGGIGGKRSVPVLLDPNAVATENWPAHVGCTTSTAPPATRQESSKSNGSIVSRHGHRGQGHRRGPTGRSLSGADSSTRHSQDERRRPVPVPGTTGGKAGICKAVPPKFKSQTRGGSGRNGAKRDRKERLDALCARLRKRYMAAPTLSFSLPSTDTRNEEDGEEDESEESYKDSDVLELDEAREAAETFEAAISRRDLERHRFRRASTTATLFHQRMSRQGSGHGLGLNPFIDHEALEEREPDSSAAVERVVDLTSPKREGRKQCEGGSEQEGRDRRCDDGRRTPSAAAHKHAIHHAAERLAPLTAKDETVVQEALRRLHHAPDEMDPHEKLRRYRGVKGTFYVTRRSIETLQDKTWINDEIVNSFMCLLQQRDRKMARKHEGWKRSMFVSSQFYTALLDEGHIDNHNQYAYNNVERWFRSRLIPGTHTPVRVRAR